jgi:hypothetical protein
MNFCLQKYVANVCNCVTFLKNKGQSPKPLSNSSHSSFPICASVFLVLHSTSYRRFVDLYTVAVIVSRGSEK